MFIIKSYTWWYQSGLNIFLAKVKDIFASVTDFFSMTSLIRTLFKPYRQISADTAESSASLDLKFHMFLDRLISRIVGFVSRLFLLLVGCIFIIILGAISLIVIIIWPFLPLAPIAGIFLTIFGVTL